MPADRPWPEPARPAETPAQVPAEWEGILAEGERILWQGRPAQGVDFSKSLRAGNVAALFAALFGVGWTLFAINMLWDAGSRAPVAIRIGFPLFGLFFIFNALRGVFGEALHDARQRRGTFYTLSTHAAYLATDIGGARALNRVALEDTSSLWLGGNARQMSLYFARGPKRVPNRAKGGWHTVDADLGFEQITDAREVYATMREARAARIEAIGDQKDATE